MKTGSLEQEKQKNNSSSDEIYEKKNRLHLDRLEKNTEIAKELNINPVSEKYRITEEIGKDILRE